jgi:hypothetical protein
LFDADSKKKSEPIKMATGRLWEREKEKNGRKKKITAY